MEETNKNCASMEQISEVSSTESVSKLAPCTPSSFDQRGQCGEERLKPRLEGKSSAEGSRSSKGCLRSSLLSSSWTSPGCAGSSPVKSKTFVLNPPKLVNPFTSASDEDNKEEEADKESEHKSPKEAQKELSSSSLSFVPLGSGERATNTHVPAPVPSVGSFVFGQNLKEKVENPKGNDEVSSSSDGPPETLQQVEEPKANGTTSEMLFTSAVKSEVPEPKSDGEGAKSLSEAAREYEEARAVKRKFEAVEVITGEEHESNILQMNCKLWAYDKASLSWQERGRGTLRLNDISNLQSRLIVRAAGSLRLLLNTNIWAGMTVQRANPKSLRLNATDIGGDIRVFVVSATVKEVDQLQRCLDMRINLKKTKETSGDSKRNKPEAS